MAKKIPEPSAPASDDKEGRWQVVNKKNVVIASGIVWDGPKEVLHTAINAAVQVAALYGLPSESATAFTPKGKKNFIAQLRKRPKDGQLPYKAVDSGDSDE